MKIIRKLKQALLFCISFLLISCGGSGYLEHLDIKYSEQEEGLIINLTTKLKIPENFSLDEENINIYHLDIPEKNLEVGTVKTKGNTIDVSINVDRISEFHTKTPTLPNGEDLSFYTDKNFKKIIEVPFLQESTLGRIYLFVDNESTTYIGLSFQSEKMFYFMEKFNWVFSLMTRVKDHNLNTAISDGISEGAMVIGPSQTARPLRFKRYRGEMGFYYHLSKSDAYGGIFFMVKANQKYLNEDKINL